MALGRKVISGLKSAVRGEVLLRGDRGYDATRRVYNGSVDSLPALIVRCAEVNDVLCAVNTARDYDLPLAVRGGGHSAAGFGVCEGGLMLDLSPMKGARVDPLRRRARAEAGMTWGEFDRLTQEHGLATTGARISSTGISGVTLGGGYGWLMRKHGLAVDNLLAVDVITADGCLLKADGGKNEDLFWGVRGGGGNFGVVTSFEYRLHPVGPLVLGGAAFYPAARAAEVLRFFRGFIASAPDELGALCNYLITPSAPFVPPELRGVPVVAIAVCHVGPAEQARRDLEPMSELGAPLLDRIKPMPYTTVQRLFDAAGVFGYYVYGKSGHLVELSDEVIETLAAHAARITSPLSIVMISALGGAVGRVGEHDTAFGHRRTAFDCAINSVWTDPGESPRHVGWTDDFWLALRPFTSGVYVNELGDEGEERVREAYNPAAYRRLVALKHKYDPRNLFRLNQNIKPCA